MNRRFVLPLRFPHRPVGVLAGLVALGAFCAPAAGLEVVTLEPAAEARAGVATRPVEEHAFGDRLRVVGRVVRSPGSTVTVKALVEGRIESLAVAPGERVERGAPLVVLHSHDLHEMRARYLRAREASRLAENRVHAGEQLLELEGISRLDLEERRQRALAARLEVEAVLADLEFLGYDEAQVETFDRPDWHAELTVRAPSAGVVLDLAVEEQGWVSHYEPMVTLGDPDRLELELQIPPDEAGRVEPGDRVDFGPVGRPERASLAEVITGVPRVDPTTRTVTVRARIVEGLGESLPGVFVEGTLVHGEDRASPAVPESAVIRVDQGDHVFVKIAPGTYEARPVRVGAFDGERYQVLDGVAVGEEVAVAGVFLLKSALVRAGEGDG